MDICRLSANLRRVLEPVIFPGLPLFTATALIPAAKAVEAASQTIEIIQVPKLKKSNRMACNPWRVENLHTKPCAPTRMAMGLISSVLLECSKR